MGVWDRLSQFSFVRLTYQVCVSKKIGEATAASLKGLKCRGASLRRNHEAERDQEAIQSQKADRKRIGLWQLRLKYRRQRLASLCVPKRAGRCGGGDFKLKHEPAQQPYPKKHVDEIEDSTTCSNHWTSSQQADRVEFKRENRSGCGTACLASHLFAWHTKTQTPNR